MKLRLSNSRESSRSSASRAAALEKEILRFVNLLNLDEFAAEQKLLRAQFDDRDRLVVVVDHSKRVCR